MVNGVNVVKQTLQEIYLEHFIISMTVDLVRKSKHRSGGYGEGLNMRAFWKISSYSESIDCKFLVGKNKEEVGVSRCSLSNASPIFAKIIYESFPKEKPIMVPDVEPEIFKKLLKFISSNQIEISNSEEACKIITAAHRYIIPQAVEKCKPFLVKFLDQDNNADLQCNILNTAVKCDLKDIKFSILKRIEENPSTLLESPEMTKLSKESFVYLLQFGNLNVKSEMNLINAAMKWGIAHCKNKYDSVNSDNLRTILKETHILHHLRFLTLTSEQLTNGPVRMGILTVNEAATLSAFAEGDCRTPLPPYFCTISEPRALDTQYIIVETKTTQGRQVRCGSEFTDFLYVSEFFTPFILLKVILPTQTSEVCQKVIHSFSYDEHLEVEISVGSRGIFTLYAVGYYMGPTAFNSEVAIAVRHIRCESASIIHRKKAMRIIVKFRKSGRYPELISIDSGPSKSISYWAGHGCVIGLLGYSIKY